MSANRHRCQCGAKKDVLMDFCRTCFVRLPRDLRTKLCFARGAMNRVFRDRSAHDNALNECLAFLAEAKQRHIANIAAAKKRAAQYA
jgi:hypothetical protein